jgi:hypothetical protein
MIGIMMAVTIAVCVAGFSVIYAALDDTIGDFVSRDVPDPIIPTAEPTEGPAVAQQETGADEEEPVEQEATEAAEPTPEPTEQPDGTETPGAGEDDGEFSPDYQSSVEARLNFRSEPSTAGGESTILFSLEEGTLLEFSGETQPSDDPDVDGEDGWMLFTLEDGTEGWLRAIDVTPYEP